MRNGLPSMTALLGLVALAGYQNRDKIAEWMHGVSAPSGALQPSPSGRDYPGGLTRNPQGQPGGIADILGNLGAGVSGLLGNGIRELVDHFGQNGQGDAAQSWVRQGPNAQVSDQDLRAAIGPDVLRELSQRTGLPEADLLARLSKDLPEAVDRYTPDGRIPA